MPPAYAGSAEPDVPALETAFLGIFTWTQRGVVASGAGDKPYRWRRDEWEAVQMSTSPVGPYQVITGPGIVAYFRPGETGFGFSRRIDLRTRTTPEKLIAAAAGIGQPALPAARFGDWMSTYTGKRFYPLDPAPEDFDIHDIAHSLSMTARFAGHTDKPYYVAQHCVLSADRAPPSLKYEALMHDRAEAYLQDIVRPVKKSLPSYAFYETAIERASAPVFGLPESMSPGVKLIDTRMLGTEARQLFSHGDAWWDNPPYDKPYDLTIRPWGQATAERIFLKHFDKLAPAHVRQKQGR